MQKPPTDGFCCLVGSPRELANSRNASSIGRAQLNADLEPPPFERDDAEAANLAARRSIAFTALTLMTLLQEFLSEREAPNSYIQRASRLNSNLIS